MSDSSRDRRKNGTASIQNVMLAVVLAVMTAGVLLALLVLLNINRLLVLVPTVTPGP